MKSLIAFILFFAVSAFAADSTQIADLKAKVEEGDIDAQIQLARIYNRGNGVIRSDFIEAEKLLRPLAEQGNARAQLELGYLHDPENARMMNLAWARADKIIDSLTKEYFKSLGIAAFPDSILVRDSIQNELDRGNRISSEYWKYTVYLHIEPYGGATLPDSIESRVRDSVELELDSEQWFLKAANQGLAEAQCALGWHYESRGGNWKNRELHDEFYWNEKAAEQDYTPAQRELGMLYSAPVGAIRNMPRAFFWSKIASDKNDTYSLRIFESVKKEITTEELKEAQKLLDDWYKRKKE